MDRISLTAASVRVTHEFGLSEAQYGNIEVAFGWAFAAGSLIFGVLADRWRIYFLYPGILAAWSVMGIATGWTHNYEGLLVCRGLLGFFEAGQWPCAVRTTYALLDEKDRMMGNSILQSGAAIGAVVTPQIMKMMVTDRAGSWRAPFIAIGAIGLFWVVIWFVFLRPRDLRRAPAAAPAKRKPMELGRILIGGRFWAVALLIVGPQTVWSVYRVWLMKFLQNGRGYSERAALDFDSIYFVAADIGCFAAGLASLWLIRRRGVLPHRARRRVYMGGCVLTSLSIVTPWLGKGWPLLGTILLVGAGALALFPSYYSFIQELPAAYVGRLTGILGAFAWIVTSPVHSFFGHLIDRTGSYDVGLGLAGLVPWIGVIAMALLWRIDPVPVAGEGVAGG